MKLSSCFDDRMVMMLHFRCHTSTFRLVSPDWSRSNVAENFKSCIEAIQRYTEWKAAESAWIRASMNYWEKHKPLVSQSKVPVVFEMREVEWEMWRTGRRICWHSIPRGQNQQNSFGSWYLKVVDLLTGQHDEVMTALLSFLFLGNEIIRHLAILVSTWVYSLMLTGTPISSATIWEVFSFLSYEGKSPANLLHLLIQTHAANSLISQ